MHPPTRRYSQQLQQQNLQHYSHQQNMPAPIPPFSRPRPSYPPNHDHDYEDERENRRRNRQYGEELVHRAAYDMMRRRHAEIPADPAQNYAPATYHPGVPADILRVDYVDFQPHENGRDHRTFQYEQVYSHDRPMPVFRRGQPFHLSLVTREREFDCSRDHLYLNFYLGPNPSVPKRTRVVLPVTLQREFSKAPHKWDVRMHSQEGNSLTLQVHIPATCGVGVWRCVVETATKNCPKNRTQYRSHDDIYIIFNPFSRDDAVYLENESLRNEYVMNDNGKIYMGDSKYIHGRPWVYGQFDDCVLPTACILLEKSGLHHTERGNPVKVARALCSMIRGYEGRQFSFKDDCGLIEPHYEDDFRGGQNPHLWTGSVKVFEEYLYRGAHRVKFGHCWVMAALMTTVCRAFGLPSRPTTALNTAHDTQETLTLDRYVDRFGDLIERGPGRDQPDSLWAYHTWCDVWMARPDLPSGYSGWQALDPSRSYSNKFMSMYGPCSAESVKRGDVGNNQDTAAFYELFNSHVRYFYEDEDSEWGYSPFKQHKTRLCRSIITKAVGRYDDEGEADCEDITKMYRDMERSEPERCTVFNACRGIRKDHVYYDYQDKGSNDINYEIQDGHHIKAGQTLSITLVIYNNCSDTRTVQATLSARSAFYTGVLGPHMKRVTGQFTLSGGQKDTLALRLDPSEYQGRLVDQGFVKVTATGHVQESKQSYIDEFEYYFEKPRMSIEVSECQVGQETNATFTFTNPLDVPLTDCYFSMEVGGAYRPRTVRVGREIRARESFTYSYTFVPRCAGERRLVAAFTSRQLCDIRGSRRLTIRE